MSNIFELFQDIEQQPGLYLGNASVTALRHFLVGYKFARQQLGLVPTDEELDFYHNFQPWLQLRLQVRTTNSWDKMILFKWVDEKVAFTRFFRLLSEFRTRDKSQNLDLMVLSEALGGEEKAA